MIANVTFYHTLTLIYIFKTKINIFSEKLAIVNILRIFLYLTKYDTFCYIIGYYTKMVRSKRTFYVEKR